MNKLPDNQAYRLLERYKIPVASYKFIKFSKKFAEDVIKGISDLPVVIKIDADVVHKKNAGCVEIIYKKEDIKHKVDSVIKNSRKFHVNGMLIQKFVSGDEVMIGSKRDVQFGTIIMFGCGGVLADTIKDVSFRVIPVTSNELEIMIKETKAYQIFIENKMNLPDIIDAISNLIRLMEDNVEIKEVDINPFFLSEECVAGDVRIIKR